MSGNSMMTSETEAVQFADFDREFGSFLLRRTGSSSRELLLAAMLAARELRLGNPQLDLKSCAGGTFIGTSGEVEKFPPDAEAWQNILVESGAAAEWDENGDTLLVLTGNCTLMLRRYAGYEELVKKQLLMRRQYTASVDADFEFAGDTAQDLAVFTALNSRLLILTGGPGTGKTTVCSRIITEVIRRKTKKNILLGAPTGKAQQRLISQIRQGAVNFPEGSEERQAMQEICGTTIHSMLYNGYWRQQLDKCDLLVLDECSMISLSLFAAILQALPDNASLILAGDKRQLAPVESGSLFSDLCGSGRINCLPREYQEILSGKGMTVETCSSGDDFSGYIVELQKNYRSAQAPAICALAEMLRSGHAEWADSVKALVETNTPDYTFISATPEQIAAQVREKCSKWEMLPSLCSSGDIDQIRKALELIENFRFLCASVRGSCGTVQINRLVLEALKLQPQQDDMLKPGTVLLIIANDRSLGLCNGDTGIVTLENTDAGNAQLCVRFGCCPEQPFLLSDLPAYDYGFALTVHKAQGSGYRESVFILPGYNSQLLDRKMIYTGITRSSQRLEVWGTEAEIGFALKNDKTRSSNLFQRT